MTLDEKLYTVSDIADKLHITRRTIYNHMKDGKLQGTKIGQYWYFTEAEIQEFLNSGTRERKSAPKSNELP